MDNQLFCGHNNGTFLIINNEIQKVSNIQGTWNIKSINGRDDLLLQGNYNGLNLLEKIDNTWRFKNKIKDNIKNIKNQNPILLPSARKVL